MQMSLPHEYGCSEGELAIHAMLTAVLSVCDTAPEPNAVAFLPAAAVDTDAATANGSGSNTEDDRFKLYPGMSQQVKDALTATVCRHNGGNIVFNFESADVRIEMAVCRVKSKCFDATSSNQPWNFQA